MPKRIAKERVLNITPSIVEPKARNRPQEKSGCRIDKLSLFREGVQNRDSKPNSNMLKYIFFIKFRLTSKTQSHQQNTINRIDTTYYLYFFVILNFFVSLQRYNILFGTLINYE